MCALRSIFISNEADVRAKNARVSCEPPLISAKCAPDPKSALWETHIYTFRADRSGKLREIARQQRRSVYVFDSLDK